MISPRATEGRPEEMLDTLVSRFVDLWPAILAVLAFVIGVCAAAHAVLYKRDTRATIAWVGLIALVPILGSLLYVLFGVNRIRRRARALRIDDGAFALAARFATASSAELDESLGPRGAHLEALTTLVGEVTGRPLLSGNAVSPFFQGRDAYAAMLAAIDAAASSVALCTFIFDRDRAGKRFVAALQRAMERGVLVRVIVDEFGARYSFPSILGLLRRAGVPVAEFLPTRTPRALRFANLRNHRKILVVDGRVGFTGGMNIREAHSSEFGSDHAIRDVHFRLEGPVVSHLHEIFADDWRFCTGEVLTGEHWQPAVQARGPVLARGISDGPDGDVAEVRFAMLGALACAQTSVRIVTPYFLPDAGLVTALTVAALRGVRVDIVLPKKNNLLMVQWASTALLWQVLEHGCRVWFSPPPFDHSKLMVVDGVWTLLGSVNWDPRSLRLSFELDVECYDRALATALEAHVDAVIAESHEVTLAEVDGRPLPIKLRDGTARLFSPYL